jgi:hypothetical protein
MSIIGISGKKNSGKNTVAIMIQYLYHTGINRSMSINTYIAGYNENVTRPDGYRPPFKEVAFADKVKDIVCILTSCTREQLEDEEFKNKELGEDWRVYYAVNYKLKLEKNPTGKVGSLCSNKVDAYIEIEKLHQKLGIKCTLGTHIPTYRELLQWTGTDFGRRIISPDIWINATMKNYKYYTFGKISIDNGDLVINSNKDVVVVDRVFENTFEDKDGNLYNCNKWSAIKCPNWLITDVRFPNEVKAIEDRGGFVIRVERDINVIASARRKFTNMKEAEVVAYDFHLSETSLDDHKFKYIIHNNSSINDLIDKVKLILKKEKVI